MRGSYSIIIYSALYLLLLSCNYKTIKESGSLRSAQNPTQTLTKSSVMGWELIQTKVLNTCMDCHTGTANPNLSTLSSIRQNLDKMLSEINTNAMPKSNAGYAPLSDCQKEIFTHWIQNNTPEFSQTLVGSLEACKTLPEIIEEPQNSTPIAQMPLTYQTLVTRIFQPSQCLKCHNPDGEDLAAVGILFYPYQEILNRNHLWLPPGKDSRIIKVLTRHDEDRMPPPEEGEALKQDEIDFIIRWIDAGKPL